jgi:plastocyanin
MPKQTLGRTMRRIRGLYFPPWVPVAFIIVVVFGILGVMFYARSAAAAPRINDHWHATYSTFICGKRQPNFPSWPSGVGVHTHADGVIHSHPSSPTGEGAGARLVKWFEYGGGKLTQTEMRMPGRREEYKNGDDTCGDGSETVLQVFVNSAKLSDWKRYIPQDGDAIRIIFGPEQETEDVEEVSTPIPESEAVRTVDVEVTDIDGDESATAFEPDSIDLRPGEAVKLLVKNTGEISHMIRVVGPDGEYDTGDDFLAKTADGSHIMEPGEEATVVVRFDEAGEFEFKDPTVVPEAGGVLVVAGEPFEGTAEPGPDGGTLAPVDVTLDVAAMGNSSFEPSELEVEAGQTFRINLTNGGEFVHNLRIAGQDGEYRTEDDFVSTPEMPKAGEDGMVEASVDEPGVYSFRSDYHPTEMVGTITVR